MDEIIKWAIEIQSLAQAGLEYGTGVYDLERYKRLREISAEMMSYKTDIPIEKVTDLFCNEKGYQTPKIDTRAVIFKDDKILLVYENEGYWTLPGGWCEVTETIATNTIKEAKEEAGVNVKPLRIIAIQDRNKHNKPITVYSICKIFVLCELLGGEFKENSETIKMGYFALDELPENISDDKSTKEQIQMCFKAKDAKNWEVLFD